MSLANALSVCLAAASFNDLPERFGLLAADGRKLAEAVIGILFENAERIATGD